MDEKPDQIMSHIESQRNQLRENLHELETRVRRTTDWRAQFDRNPMMMMGIAMGGGLLLGSIVAGKVGSHSSSSWSDSQVSSPAGKYSTSSFANTPAEPLTSALHSDQRGKVTDTLENIKGALLAFGTAKLREFISEALPGFHQHYEEMEHRNRARPNSARSNAGASGYTRSEYREPVGAKT